MSADPGAGPASLLQRGALRAWRVTAFAGQFLLRFLRANLAVAREVLTPGLQVAPAVVVIPVRSRTPFEVASFMSLIALTPGTLPIELDRERRLLTVHGMHAGDPDAFRAELSDLEDQMLTAWRPVTEQPEDRAPDDDRRS
ncbi:MULTISPECIES: Na+/H+ antiporter subunit E [unclassified Modestobacter]|uniref:Na+/H+ antiporter subunit E n=1 Tax=unclassified Modestobacter TaxID=2643866 RepID=UPI0022A9FF21|nr:MULTISPECIES: Na+/H+ antiporter subunit E [unclassified Modestobacter]MCZ2812424.1 Na+/H+ antiporter subunit E [Modestobacter sp. VKM Ac-2979]MCZ2841314.1 Na+/H+ antiporter subunit E [Modestobacter sp. VKM Ac-2980]MCZ2850048.1 Na+/H+ antiporter subunit E [Modestobacter sp. VKM Ac-2978]